jgi:hypothetical protein
MAMALGLSLVLAGCSKDDDSKLAGFSGTYHVKVRVNLLPNEIETDLILTEDGGNFKASAKLDDYGKIEIVLSSVTEMPASFTEESEADPGTVSGFLFKVKQQDITLNLPAPDTKITIEGEEIEFGDESITGYHGFVAKGKENGQERKAIVISLKGIELLGQLSIFISPVEE